MLLECSAAVLPMLLSARLRGHGLLQVPQLAVKAGDVLLDAQHELVDLLGRVVEEHKQARGRQLRQLVQLVRRRLDLSSDQRDPLNIIRSLLRGLGLPTRTPARLSASLLQAQDDSASTV